MTRGSKTDLIESDRYLKQRKEIAASEPLKVYHTNVLRGLVQLYSAEIAVESKLVNPVNSPLINGLGFAMDALGVVPVIGTAGTVASFAVDVAKHVEQKNIKDGYGHVGDMCSSGTNQLDDDASLLNFTTWHEMSKQLAVGLTIKHKEEIKELANREGAESQLDRARKYFGFGTGSKVARLADRDVKKVTNRIFEGLVGEDGVPLTIENDKKEILKELENATNRPLKTFSPLSRRSTTKLVSQQSSRAIEAC